MAKQLVDITTPIVAFVGRSGSGKTTLLERLLPIFVARGVRVAVAKHAVRHAVESDVPGTDTYRFWHAGAQEVALVAGDRLVTTRRFSEEPSLMTVLNGVGDVDLILLEGYKRSPTHKIEVVRDACDPAPLDDLDGRVAYVTDVEALRRSEVAVPVFGFEDLVSIVNFLMARLPKEKRDGALD
jgi:molybdopterin-guanine dinucleotide biosynthesis protein B